MLLERIDRDTGELVELLTEKQFAAIVVRRGVDVDEILSDLLLGGNYVTTGYVYCQKGPDHVHCS